MMIKRFLLFIAVILMVSCSNEDRNKIPGITPNKIELSTAHPEGFFQFMEVIMRCMSLGLIMGRMTLKYQKE